MYRRDVTEMVYVRGIEDRTKVIFQIMLIRIFYFYCWLHLCLKHCLLQSYRATNPILSVAVLYTPLLPILLSL